MRGEEDDGVTYERGGGVEGGCEEVIHMRGYYIWAGIVHSRGGKGGRT